MQLLLRRPFAAADAREKAASWPITAFVVLVSGFVVYELCTEWPAAKSAFLWVPARAGESLGLSAGNGWVKGVWMLVVLPLFLWCGLGALAVLLGGAKNMAQAWRRLALPLVVVVAAGHMAKGLAKIVSWGGFLPRALSDPHGTETARAITEGTVDAPGPLLDGLWVSLAAVGLLLDAGAFAVREARKANPDGGERLATPILLLTLGFGFLASGWSLVSW